MHASEQQLPPDTTAVLWQEIEPHLSGALDSLPAADREAVLLRFYRQGSYRDVAQTLRTSEDGARKRVDRALEKLRRFFTKKGAMLSATGLAGVLTANAVQAAPASLATTCAGTALGGTLTATETLMLAKGALQAMFIAKVKTVSLAAAACLVVAGTGVVVATQLTEPQTTVSPAAHPTAIATGSPAAKPVPLVEVAQAAFPMPPSSVDEAELERQRRLEDARRTGNPVAKTSSASDLAAEKERLRQLELQNNPSTPAVPPPPVEQGLITGVIVDANGNPLSRVSVHCYRVGVQANWEYVVTHTGDDGTFVLKSVPANKPFALEACHGTTGADSLSRRGPVTVAKDQTVDVGRLTLSARDPLVVGSIRGIVVGSPYEDFEELRKAEMGRKPIAWNPMPNAQVMVEIPGCKNYVGFTVRLETKTGPDGSFEMDGVPVHSGIDVIITSAEGKQTGRVGFVGVAQGKATNLGTLQIRPPYRWPAGIK